MEMNLNHLKYFYDAVSQGQLSAAARKNRISQSAVSQAIASLENKLQCRLLIHQRKRLQLTDAGKAAYEECRKVFDSLESFHQTVTKDGAGYRGELNIGASHSIAMALLPEVLSKLSDEHPLLRINLRLGNSEIIRDWLSQGVIEGGFAVDQLKDGRFVGQEVLSGKYVAVACAGFRRPMDGAIVVTRRERPEVQSFFKAYKKTEKVEASLKMEITSWEVMKSLVLAGLGVGIFPEYVVAQELRKKLLRSIPVAGWSHSYDVRLLHSAQQPPSSSLNLLMKYLSQANK